MIIIDDKGDNTTDGQSSWDLGNKQTTFTQQYRWQPSTTFSSVNCITLPIAFALLIAVDCLLVAWQGKNL